MTSPTFPQLRKRRIQIIVFIFQAVVLLLPGVSQAQVATASINGTVADSSGAAVPGAKVSLTNVATNVAQSTITNDTGNYVLVNIIPGRYTLSVSKEGFRTANQPEFDLAVNQTTTLNFNMRIGSAIETVTVEALTTSIQTSSSELGTVISRRSVDDLPLNGRNFTQLLNLTPGVSTVNTTQNGSNQQFAGNTVGSFSFPSINGQTNRSNLFLLDGLNDQESFSSTYSVPPIIDDIQEFKVDSHNDQAQFGGVLGGVVNVVTKSGTNQFHGEAWEFIRNSAFDARNPITGINLLHQNQFGANIGGPVILPRYNGRNRTFFFGSYEGVRLHVGNANLSLIPTAAELNGDFTGGNQLYNPYSTTSSGTRTPFLCVGTSNAPAPLMTGTKLQAPLGTTTPPAGQSACNILPPGLIDPNMQAVGRLLYGGLTPNLIGVTGKNFKETLTNKQDPDSYNVRIDEQLGPRDAFWGRYSHISSPRDVPGIFGQANLNTYHAHQYGITWNHTFGPTSVLSVQFGRNYGFSANPTLLPASVSQALIKAGGYDNSFTCAFVQGPRNCYFNAVNFSDSGDITSFQEGSSPAVVADIWQWKGNFTKTHGKHTFSMGADFNSNGFRQTFNTNHLDFSAAQTANSPSKGQFGRGFASFLLGIPAGDTYRNEFETEHGGWIDGFYFQDQWRVTDRLTLNLGARYDVTFVPVYGSPKDGNVPIGNWDLNTGNYVLQSSAPACNTVGNKPPCIPTPDGSLPAHVVVSPDGRFWHNSYDNIQPRVGIAYRITTKTVLRGAYGRFYDNWAAVLQMAQNQQGTWPRADQFILAFNNTNDAPSIFAENPLQGANIVPSLTAFETTNNWFVDPNIKNPYSDQWNFGVQEALTPNTTLTVNYVGSSGHRLDVGITGNQATTPDPTGKLLVPSVSCYTTTCTPALVAAQGRFRFPYLVPIHYDESVGKSWYDGLQVSLDKKAAHGLSYLVSYTWSKAIDIGADEWFGTGTNGTSVQNPYNLAGDKGLAGFDLPQIFIAHVIYELPFGKGKRFGTGLRSVDALIGGWQINGISSFSSGTLFNVVAANSIPNVGSGSAERANLVGDPHSGTCPNGAAAGTLQCWFNIAAFAIPSTGTYGNFGRNVLRGDGRANVDFSIFRSFPITESKRLEFRAEAFNLTNSPIWGNPNANFSNLTCVVTKDGSNVAPCSPDSNSKGRAPTPTSLFGTVNSTATGYSPRQIQFALKFYY
jgi:hypothetical protein